MLRRNPLRLAAPLLGVLACACVAAERPTPATERHPITVRETRETLELSPVAVVTSETRDGAAVLAFAEAYQRRGRRGVTIALPGGANGPAGAQAAALLSTAGIAPSEVRTLAYDPQGRPDAPIVLMFDAYEAEGPSCYDTFGDLTATYSGRPFAAFGCSMQANLAAMVVDPSDLLGPRPLDPIDPGRRLVVIEKYRAGETTTTERDDEETAAVSDAVE